MSIEVWPRGQQRMSEYSMCIAKQYDRQKYVLEILPHQRELVTFDEDTGKLTLIQSKIKELTPLILQPRVSLIDPEFPNCFQYTISETILINMKPILKVDRLDLEA